MSEQDLAAFIGLFREVYLKCLGVDFDKPLSESESRLLSSEIEDKTGLVIGWKSLKNYAVFVLVHPPDKQVNPSVATLDTLARYVSDAAPTTEAQRKKSEAHFPYWFRYKEKYRDAYFEPTPTKPARKTFLMSIIIFSGLVLFAVFYLKTAKPVRFLEDFHSVDETYLEDQGWLIQNRESTYWDKRGMQANALTLFTLQGDNWPKKGETPVIRNLLYRKIPAECFNTEVQFSDFVPVQNWQQAGLLLLEDTAYVGKSIRLSLSYNDFFGGYSRPGEIIIQAIASYGKAYTNLEEIVHHTVFTFPENGDNNVIAYNLKSSAVRIEKQGNTFRFLYSVSPTENFSFKELATYTFDMDPKFVGVFALKGFVDSTKVMPVDVRFFRLEGQDCK